MITETNIELIKEHALAEFPNECVGVLVDDKYHTLTNVHTDPTMSFKVDPVEFENAKADGTNIILVHSHPFETGDNELQDRYFRYLKFDRRTPSKFDMATAQAMAIPFAIVAVNHKACSEPLIFNTTDDIELIGREFVHGVYDCWAAVRDYYKQKLDIILPNPPREFNWWYDSPDDNLYSQMEELGFTEVEMKDIQKHDVIMFSIDTEVINHAGVYIDMDRMYHHQYQHSRQQQQQQHSTQG